MSPVAVLANDYYTSASAATTTQSPSAQVLYLGAMSARPADTHLGAAEKSIDYAAGSAALVAAPDVEEAASSSVSTSSPFGI